MSYQVFLLFEKEEEQPLFIGNKTSEEEVVLSRYEKLDVFFGKQLEFIIVEDDIPSQYIAVKVEETVHDVLSKKFPDVKIYCYKDFLDEQRSFFNKAAELLTVYNRSIIEGDKENIETQKDEIDKLLKKYKRGFKRKFSFEQVQKLKEKFSGSGNGFFSRKHNEDSKKKIGKKIKQQKESYIESRKKTITNYNQSRKGKTWIELFGEEKATEIKKRLIETRLKNKKNPE